MSWQSYVDALLGPDSCGNQPIEDVAIWGQDPVSEWVATPGLKGIKPCEVNALKGDRSGFLQNGTEVAGMKCLVLRDNMDDDKMYMLNAKTRKDSEGNQYFMSIGKTHKAFIFAKGKKEALGGPVSTHLFTTVNHLRVVDY